MQEMEMYTITAHWWSITKGAKATMTFYAVRGKNWFRPQGTTWFQTCPTCQSTSNTRPLPSTVRYCSGQQPSQQVTETAKRY